MTTFPQGHGYANQYTIRLAAGAKYLVIGRANVLCHGVPTNVYVGRPTDLLEANETTRKHLHVLQRADGRCLPAHTDEIPGSLLLVSEPEYLEFESGVELLPIVYQAIEGSWDVSVEAAPPEGFVSDPPGPLSASLSDSTQQALQFTITDIGSDWTATRLTHHIRHNGRAIERLHDAKMVNRRSGRRGVSETASDGDTSGEPEGFVPTAYVLLQNFPDPFNPTTTLRFDVPEAADVTLRVYNVLGREVATVVERQHYEIGRHAVVFHAKGLPAGIYVYQLRAGRFVDARKMVVVK